MREALSQLIENTIIYEYSLPNLEKGIEKVHLSTKDDDCFSATNQESLVSIIYNSILDYSFQEFDLTQVIDTIIKRYEIFSTTLEYQFIVNTQKPILVKADKQKLEQVIYNLINNAINYTGEDKKVYIQILEAKKEITVEITDTGKGIDQEEIPLIWDKYYRSQKNHQRNTVGTGLGLSIVKNILELHHFEYGVRSKKGKGTTFYFKIHK